MAQFHPKTGERLDPENQIVDLPSFEFGTLTEGPDLEGLVERAVRRAFGEDISEPTQGSQTNNPATAAASKTARRGATKGR